MLGLKLTPLNWRPRQWWPQGASSAIDFIANRSMFNGLESPLDSILEFSRGSTKLAADASGNYHGFAEDQLARTNRGASLEPQATELLPRNSFSGMTPARGSGAFPMGWSVVGPSSEFAEILAPELVCNVETQPLRYNGGGEESYAGFRTAGGLPHSSGADYWLSLYARLPPGKVAFDLYWYTPLDSEGIARIVEGAALTPDWQRFVVARQAGSTGAREVNLIKTAVLSADHAIDIALPMLREARPGSFIPTTGSPATRAADRLALTPVDLGISAASGSLFLRFALDAQATGQNERLLSLEGANSAEDCISIIRDTNGNIVVAVISDGVLQFERSFDPLPVGETHKIGMAWGGGSVRVQCGNAAAETIAATAPTSLEALAIGAGLDGAEPTALWLEALAAYPSHLDDTAFAAALGDLGGGL